MEPLNIISLGAGVQSSALALMAARGEITPMPDMAVFADTQAEPEGVYEWLNWLEKELPFPVVRVTAGNLPEDALQIYRKKADGRTYLKGIVPAFVRTVTNDLALLWRKCTNDYKIVPIQRHLRQFKARGVVLYLGISTDEAHRMKDSRVSWIKHRWPLIEQRISRADCLRWMEANGYPAPPRSACVFCPYHSDAEWMRLRDEEPKAFADAVRFDHALREKQKQQETLESIPYLHRSLVPLEEVEFRHENQRSLFGNECEGMCGV